DDRTDTRSEIAGDVGQIAQLFDALRATGSQRVLEEVLALVLDLAIEVTGADRGVIMLGDAPGTLEMRAARAGGKVSLKPSEVAIRKEIPQRVFATGSPKVVANLHFDWATLYEMTMGLEIREVLCTPLRPVQYVDHREWPPPLRTIGVLYLESRQRG